MPKINPTSFSLINNLKPIKSNNIKSFTTSVINKPSNKLVNIASVGTIVGMVSTFLQDYKSTVEDKNYFQLKTNEETQKPYKPDVFQNAAGMNLYLGNDVLVTAPTGTGKTAIAEYVISKNLNDGKRTFYTTPLKALSNEKFLDFSRIYGEENVGLITGDTKVNKDAPIIVMTTEVYRNMAATDKFDFDKNDEKKGIPNNVKTVIFDELQYLGDVDRGGIWEQSIMFTPKDIQILSLSATIANNEEINNWIAFTKGRNGISVTPDSQYIPTNKKTKETVLINVPPQNRHVPLNFNIEHTAPEVRTLKNGTKAEKLKAKKESSRRAQSLQAIPRREAYKSLTAKLNQEGKLPAIYFVFNKKESKKLLKYLSTESELLTTEKEQKEIQNIIDNYEREGIYLGESLDVDAIKKGYALHNSGLLPTQKRLVEELFQKKLIKVVIATETLSAGINMPAKTTVISAPRKPSSTSDNMNDGKRALSPNEFHQMAGRAGRRGIDTQGFCYPLSCNNAQTNFYNELINSPSNNLNSNLSLDFSFIANYLNEFRNEEEIEYILSKSLYAYKNKEKINDILEQFKEKTEILKQEGFVNFDNKLTTKGELLTLINGYEQIPIINLVTNYSLANLNEMQIAGLIGGMANLNAQMKNDIPDKPLMFDKISDKEFELIAKQIDSNLKEYELEIQKISPEHKFSINTSTMEHLYKWAELNKTKPKNGVENWKELCIGEMKSSIKDEGSVFKEITMTADLIKQLINISELGGKLTGEKYYAELGEKLQRTLDLIQHEPISEK
jgi:superfamily II RNA helicase